MSIHAIYSTKRFAQDSKNSHLLDLTTPSKDSSLPPIGENELRRLGFHLIRTNPKWSSRLSRNYPGQTELSLWEKQDGATTIYAQVWERRSNGLSRLIVTFTTNSGIARVDWYAELLSLVEDVVANGYRDEYERTPSDVIDLRQFVKNPLAEKLRGFGFHERGFAPHGFPSLWVNPFDADCGSWNVVHPKMTATVDLDHGSVSVKSFVTGVEKSLSVDEFMRLSRIDAGDVR